MSITKSEEVAAQELKRAGLLKTALLTHNSSLAPELNRQNAMVAQEGETMPDAALDLEYKARILAEASQQLTEAGTVLRDAVAERILFGEERTVWYTTTRGEMFAIQTTVRAQGGQKALDRLGLSGTLASTPEKLVLQGQHYRLRLAHPITLRTRSGGDTINVATWAQRLETPLAELELQHELYLEADQAAAKARRAKNDALQRLRLYNQTIGQETIAAFRRAGFQSLAYRLRRQLARVLRSSSTGTPGPPATDQDDVSTTPGTEPVPETEPETGSTDPNSVTETPDDTTPSGATTV